MAKDEMEMITEDQWDDEVWGIEKEESKRIGTKLIFYFGQNVSFLWWVLCNGILMDIGPLGGRSHTRCFDESTWSD